MSNDLVSDFDYESGVPSEHRLGREHSVRVGTTITPVGWVCIAAYERADGRFVSHAAAHYSPEEARRVAMALLNYANKAEQELGSAPLESRKEIN